MRRALQLAERGWGRVAPNPMVGAVLVRDGQVVGEGWHTEYGAPHAEVEAIRAAGGLARGATLYATLEPCSHQGKTPACADAIVAAGVARVVYAAADPHPIARNGADTLRLAGIEVRSGVEERAARALNAPFFHAHGALAAARPWTELKLALSLDGRLADLHDRSAWITGDEARAEVHRLRAASDATAVGIGTALADDPRLTVRGDVKPRRQPIRVVFDRMLRLPPQGRLASTARDVPVWVVCAPGPPPDARKRLEGLGVNIIEAAALIPSLEALSQAGVQSLFCEGGARLAGALLRADLVDRLTLFIAPLMLGAEGTDPFGHLPSAPLDQSHRWKLLRARAFGPDTLISVER